MKKNKVGIKNFIIVILIIGLGLGGYYFYTQNNNKQKESIYDQYSVLTNYLKINGYTCTSLLEPGSFCEKKASVNSYKFYRFDDGIQYLTTSTNYKVNIINRQGSREYSIQTFDGAFEGYKNQKYYCETVNETLLGQLDNCKTEKGEVLDNDVYLTVVKTALREIDNILEHSGYDATKLVTLYRWEK